MSGGTRRAGLVAIAVALLAACARPEPQPIRYGQDLCAHCHMTIADPRFAGELVLRTGKIYRFDDPGCLAAFVRERIPAAKVQSAWVNDFAHPDRLLDAGQASYLLSDTLRTPMASHLAALNPGREADSVQSALGGRLLTWDQVLGEVGGPPDR